MFAPSIIGRVRVNVNAHRAQARRRNHRSLKREYSRAASARSLDYLSRRSCAKADQRSTKNSQPSRAAFTLPKLRDPESIRGFTLLELLIVVGIIGLLLVLIAPAFTTIKGGTDVTSAAYTIKGVLDTARTYAKANNTYTWVGFYEENVSNPASPNSDTPAVGRVIMSIVASKDGTAVYDPNSLATIDPTKLTQVGKLTKIDNVQLRVEEMLPDGERIVALGAHLLTEGQHVRFADRETASR